MSERRRARPEVSGLPSLSGEHVLLREPREGELASIARAISSDIEARQWWSHDESTVQRWLEEAAGRVYVVEVEGDATGIIQFEEEGDPDYRFAAIDIVLLSPWTGRGVGPDALRTLARHLFESRGHHRLQIDPAVGNHRAIRAYERVGFRPVGIMREYERGPHGEWRNALLMDMLFGDLEK